MATAQPKKRERRDSVMNPSDDSQSMVPYKPDKKDRQSQSPARSRRRRSRSRSRPGSSPPESTAVTSTAPTTAPRKRRRSGSQVDSTKALGRLGKKLGLGEGMKALDSIRDKLTSDFDTNTYARSLISDTLTRIWGKDKKLPTNLTDLSAYNESAVDTKVRTTLKEWQKKLFQNKEMIRKYDQATSGAVSKSVWDFIAKDPLFRWEGTDIGTGATGITRAETEVTEPAKSSTGTNKPPGGTTTAGDADESVFSKEEEDDGTLSKAELKARQTARHKRAVAKANKKHEADLSTATGNVPRRRAVSIGGEIGRTGTGKSRPETAASTANDTPATTIPETSAAPTTAPTNDTELPEHLLNLGNNFDIPEKTTVPSTPQDYWREDSAAYQDMKAMYLSSGGTEDGWKSMSRREQMKLGKYSNYSDSNVRSWADIRTYLEKTLKKRKKQLGKKAWEKTDTENVYKMTATTTRKRKVVNEQGIEEEKEETAELTQLWDRSQKGNLGKSETWTTKEWTPGVVSEFLKDTSEANLPDPSRTSSYPTLTSGTQNSTQARTRPHALTQSRAPTSTAPTATTASKGWWGSVGDTLGTAATSFAKGAGSIASTLGSAASSLANPSGTSIPPTSGFKQSSRLIY